MNDVNRAIGQIIAALRHDANISQEELASLANIHRTYVSQIERGLKSPTIQVLLQISSALNTSASAILKSLENKTNDL